MSKNVMLNHHMYPLVAGQADKYIFSGWQEEGDTVLLKASFTGGGYGQADIVWTSSDEKVAVVSGGLVRAVRTGTADIRASLPDGSSDLCRVQVIDNIGRFTAREVFLNTDRLVLGEEEGAALYPVILPVDHDHNGILDNSFEWTSSDERVAAVDHRGRILALTAGRTVITARSRDVGREAVCHVTVVKKDSKLLAENPLEDLDGGQIAMKAPGEKTLALPLKASSQPVCWSSENPGIASVDQEGRVTAYRAGQVRIWATFVNGGKRVGYGLFIETAPVKVEKIALSCQRLYLAKGQRRPVYGVVFPAVLLERCLSWKSSDEKVVSIVRQHINLSGLDEIIAEGMGEGTAVLTATDRDGISVSCQVTVTEEPAAIGAITLPEKIRIQPETVETLRPQYWFSQGVFSENISQAPVCWICDDRRKVTVDRNGVIKGYSRGQAKIYCICEDGLSKEDRELLRDISQIRAIGEEPDRMKELEELLARQVHGVCQVTVEAESDCLFHLHVPAETVTADSLCLLWNREAQTRVGQLSHYEIYENEKKIGTTKQLSFRVKDLAPGSTYRFTVAAVEAAGENEEPKIICRQTVTAVTRNENTAVLDVTKAPYCAVGNGIASDTLAIQKAIDQCPRGGEVLLPKGYVFCSGALFLKSDMTFRVDGILFGTEDPDEYPPVVCRWEGFRKLRLTEENQKKTVPVFAHNVYAHASLVNVGVYDEGEPERLSPCHTRNVRICGEGMINGNGFSLSYNEGPCWYTGRKGLPVPQPVRRDQNVRGRLVAIYNADGVYVSDVTVGYGPSWTLQPVFSKNITFDHIRVITKGNGRTGATEGMVTLNGDGIDPDSCTHVNIINCLFTVGDDAVAIKSGRNRQGRELGKPSAYIRVTDCCCVNAKGAFAIGSEQSGGVHDVLFQNLTAENITNFGLWIKSAPFRGGLVEDVVFRDCLIKNTGGAMQIEYRHGGDEDPSPTLPVTRRVTFENIHFVGMQKFGIRLLGHPDSPISDVTLKDFRFEDFAAKKDRKFAISHCRGIQMDNVRLPEGFHWETD